MKLYRRTFRDKINGIKRCQFDADHGRTELALDRLADLNDEFSDDAEIVYAEGLIRKDYIGQGLRCYELFVKAHQINSRHTFAGCNAAKFAPTEEDFRKWTKIALALLPQKDPSRGAMTTFLRDVDRGLVEHRQLLHDGSIAHFQERMFGDSAALMEIALANHGLGLQDEIRARRMRAQCLRELDAQAHRHRDTLMEAFLPEERLALKEALAELERALSLDEYDAELWNLKAAWLTLLAQHQEAMECADRAIELRPAAYAKPYCNKANALWALDQFDEALNCVRESLAQAEASADVADIALSRKLLEDYAKPRGNPSLSGVENLIKHILNAATITSDQELGQWKGSMDNLAAGVFRRVRKLRSDQTADYIPLVTELLSDFTPDSVFVISMRIAKQSQAFYDHFLNASLYVTAHSSGVQQRDSARFLALVLLGALDGEGIKSSYRRAVLEPSAAATDAMAGLDGIMREQLRRMLPIDEQLITDQPPVDSTELRRAEINILSRFANVSPALVSQPIGFLTRLCRLVFGTCR